MNQSTQTTGGRVRRVASVASLAALVVALVGAAASPAAAQDCAALGGEAEDNICGFVTSDGTSSGTPVVGVTVHATTTGPGLGIGTTDSTGFFSMSVGDGIWDVAIVESTLPAGSVVESSPTPVDVNAMTPVHTDVNFAVNQPGDIWGDGTGTPGYWKNHPEEWPAGIAIGGDYYTTSAAIAKMGKVSGDKTLSMFAALVSAILNTTVVSNNATCISDTITSAQTWMTTYKVGSGVKASSAAWALAQEWHQRLDDYNNGKLCAPHRG
jgi:hypothetical protein